MSGTIIHPTAIVSGKAKLGVNVTVGPFTIIEDDVEVGDNTEIRSSVVLASGARIGKNCRICSSTVIGTEPQDLKFKGEPTLAIVGDNTLIREFVSINRGTLESGRTSIGSNCMIMAYCHVAHDCNVGDNVIMSNVVQLGGHVHIGHWVNLGGVSKVHQFCNVGDHAMIGADCKIVKDVSPFVLIGRTPAQVEGVNKVGLRRRGFSAELIQEIEVFYDTLLFSGLNTKDGIAKYMERGNIPKELGECIEFIETSTRGIYR